MQIEAMNFEGHRLFKIWVPDDLSAQDLIQVVRSIKPQTVMDGIYAPSNNVMNGPKDPRRVQSVIINGGLTVVPEYGKPKE